MLYIEAIFIIFDELRFKTASPGQPIITKHGVTSPGNTNVPVINLVS